MKTSCHQRFHMKAPGTKLSTSLPGLVIGCLLLGGPARAGEPTIFKPALQRQLEARVLPEVRFHNADFTDALVYLQIKALASPQDALQVPFVVELPADFKPRYELTLDLKSVPFWEALRHLGGQAGVEFSIVKDSVRVRPAGAAAAAKAAVPTVIPAPEAPAADKRMAGPLGNPARPFGTGNNNHYSTAGLIQPERSGNVSHRSLSGWSYEKDRGNRFSMNCVNITKCHANCCGKDGCGCVVCGCQPSKVGKIPALEP
ncbi:hypothetical protein [Haloferula sp. BvORR071]|uniref:hypothetical protein n=1 Tax=Haloferula sp. BvORR071 TaxID=1396141 RepID=UPI0005519EFE|nr:hypothetical protein [Haloferula sp. BvORR071]